MFRVFEIREFSGLHSIGGLNCDPPWAAEKGDQRPYDLA